MSVVGTPGPQSNRKILWSILVRRLRQIYVRSLFGSRTEGGLFDLRAESYTFVIPTNKSGEMALLFASNENLLLVNPGK